MEMEKAAELHLHHVLFKSACKNASMSCFGQQVICPTLKCRADSCSEKQQICVKITSVFCIFLVALEQKKASIDNAPACFRSMLLLFGIETAIENLIQVVGLEK